MSCIQPVVLDLEQSINAVFWNDYENQFEKCLLTNLIYGKELKLCCFYIHIE